MQGVKRPVVLVNRKTKKATFHESMTAAADRLGVYPADVRNVLIKRFSTEALENGYRIKVGGCKSIHNHLVLAAEGF